MNNTYIEPSELRSGKIKRSKFLRYVDVEAIPNLHPLPGLEERTGADLMISPIGLPHPNNDFLLKMHIDSGALLVQLKFDFDLIASILDGRYKESQSRMKLVGANPWQRVLLFIGSILETEDGTLIINGQPVTQYIPAAKNFDYISYRKQRLLWSMRGGVFEQLTLPSKLEEWIQAAGEAIEICRKLPQKQVWPTAPALYEEELEQFDNEEWLVHELHEAQKLTPVNDLRKTLVTLPNLGQKRVNAIWDALEDKSWNGFMTAIEDSSLLKLPGIGSGIIKNIKQYLKGE